jgi:hypothetical protein
LRVVWIDHFERSIPIHRRDNFSDATNDEPDPQKASSTKSFSLEAV